MSKYKINVNVEFVECNESINNEPMKNANGNFRAVRLRKVLSSKFKVNFFFFKPFSIFIVSF